jgi:hypothetical protein
LIGGVISKKTPEDLLEIPNAYFCQVQENGLMTQCSKKEVAAKSSSISQIIYQSEEMTYKLTSNILEQYLGKDVVLLLLPPKEAGMADHDQNLIVKINCLDKSGLFMGDASEKLIKCSCMPVQIPLEKRSFPDPSNSNKHIAELHPSVVDSVSFVIPSHHFSNASNEASALWKALTLSHKNRPFLTIISSNANGKDKIPTSTTIKRLVYWQDALKSCFCAPHSVSASYSVENKKEVINIYPYDIDNNVYIPVFCTADINGGYMISMAPTSSTCLLTMSEIWSNANMYTDPGIVAQAGLPTEVANTLKTVCAISPDTTPSSSSTSFDTAINLNYVTPFKMVNMQEMQELEKAIKSKLDQIINSATHFNDLFLDTFK